MNRGEREGAEGPAGAAQRAGAEAADEKARLEVEKLRAEVEEIHARTGGLSAALTRWKGIAGLAVTVLSLGAGGAGLYYGYIDFRTRSDNEAARRALQLDFEVNREVIELSQQLASTDKVQSANAAILLSAYEEHAVPILVANLHTHNKSLAESVVRSLGLILNKPRIRDQPELVLEPLSREARRVFAEELRKSEPDTLAMGYYVDAFREILAGTNDADALKLLDGLARRVDAALAARPNPDQGPKLEALRTRLGEARDAVAGRGRTPERTSERTP